MNKIAAWVVHVFTATGILFAFLAMIAMWEGKAEPALYWLAAAIVVDSVDGTFARAFRIKETLPIVDGATLDNLIDYITFTLLPLFWAYLFLDIPASVCIIAAMASSLGFSRTDAKTEDNYFLGFPSYWNIVVFYFYILDLPAIWSSAILLMLAVMVFIPLKWIYPSRTSELKTTTLALSTIYCVLIGYMLFKMTQTPDWVVMLSLFYPIYYIGASVYFGNYKSMAKTTADSG